MAPSSNNLQSTIATAQSISDDAFIRVKAEPVSENKSDESTAVPTPATPKRMIVNPYAKKPIVPDSTARALTYGAASALRTNRGAELLVTNAEPEGDMRTTGIPDSPASPTDQIQVNRKPVAQSPAKQNSPSGKSTDAPSAASSPAMEFPKKGYYAFLAAIFRTPPKDYVYWPDAPDTSQKSLQIWNDLCERTELSIVKSPLPAIQKTVAEHFDARAALVLEEAREAMAQALTTLWHCKTPQHYESFDELELIDQQAMDEPGKPLGGFIKYTLKRKQTYADAKKNVFSAAELEYLQCGTLCLLQTCGSNVATFALTRAANKDRLNKKKTFDAIGLDLPAAVTDDWTSPQGICRGEGIKLIPIDATIVSLVRQFHALSTERARTVPFVDVLLGKKPSQSALGPGDELPSVTDPPLARLNTSQAKVATTFMTSPPGSITIAQGVRLFGSVVVVVWTRLTS